MDMKDTGLKGVAKKTNVSKRYKSLGHYLSSTYPVQILVKRKKKNPSPLLEQTTTLQQPENTI
jgi:hypothetical protein